MLGGDLRCKGCLLLQVTGSYFLFHNLSPLGTVRVNDRGVCPLPRRTAFISPGLPTRYGDNASVH